MGVGVVGFIVGAGVLDGVVVVLGFGEGVLVEVEGGGLGDGVAEGVAVDGGVSVVKMNDQLLLQSLQVPLLSLALILQYHVPSVKTGL